MQNRRLSEIVVLVTLLLGSGLSLAFCLIHGAPQVGFDFLYFLPRLIDVYLHQQQEGWFHIQWWTPSFGAGLPAFFNPQHTQFMLSQFLVPIFGPWNAAVAQAAFFNAFGSGLVFWICRHRFAQTVSASLLAGATFGTCGFMWEHTLSGHMSFNVFPLVAVVPEAFHSALPTRRSLGLLALTAAAIVFGGGYTIIIIFALTCGLLGVMLPLVLPEAYSFETIVRRVLLAGAASIGAVSVKIAGAALFLNRFPRLVDYSYEGSPWLAVPSIAWQLFGQRILLCLTRWLPFSGYEGEPFFGKGEDVGFGPMSALILLAGGCLLLPRLISSFKGRWGLIVAAFAIIWIAVECSLGCGLLWPVIKPLPFIRSLHENHRFTAVFALPLALAVAPCWTALLRNQTRTTAFIATGLALLATIASLEPFFRNRSEFWHGSYDASTINSTWARIQANPYERFPIVAVADIRDDASFLNHASTWKPYEPIFGYGFGGPAFKTELGVGLVEPLATPAGSWRFHDPRSFVSSANGDVNPFSPWIVTEENDLKLFLNRHQPHWKIPPTVGTAETITLISLCAVFLMFVWPSSFYLRRPSRSEK